MSESNRFITWTFYTLTPVDFPGSVLKCFNQSCPWKIIRSWPRVTNVLNVHENGHFLQDWCILIMMSNVRYLVICAENNYLVYIPDPGLVSKYHMRPMLMVVVRSPVCQLAAAEVMIMSQSGASVLSDIQLLLSVFLTLPERLISPTLVLVYERKLFSFVIQRRAFLLVFNRCLRSPWVGLRAGLTDMA